MKRTRITDWPEIAKMFPPNVLPEEILGKADDHVRALFVDSANPVLSGRDRDLSRCGLRGKRSALSRALESLAPGAGPGHHVSNRIGDRDDRVVERGLDVRDGMRHVFLFFLAALATAFC